MPRTLPEDGIEYARKHVGVLNFIVLLNRF